MRYRSRRDLHKKSVSQKQHLLDKINVLEHEKQALKHQLAELQQFPNNMARRTVSELSPRHILHGAEDRIIDILNLLPDMILVVDLEGKVIAWNQAAEKLTAKTAQEMLGKGQQEYAIPFYGFRRPLLVDFILNSEHRQDPDYPYYKQLNGKIEAENFCPAAGVNGLYVRATAGPLYNSEGQMVGAIELLRDISESRESQAALEASEAMYRRIVETAAEGIWMIDENYRTTFVNSRMAEMLGYTPEELMGRNYLEFLEDKDRLAAKKRMEGIHSRRIQSYDLALVCKNGSIIWTIAAVSSMYDRDGSFLGTLGMFTDDTERKRLGQQMARLDRLNLVGKIAAGIGHEIRNPMTSVRGFLQMLRMQEKYQEDDEYFEIMIEELDRANSIITEFLNLTHSKPVSLKYQNLNSIIEAVYPLIQAEAMVSDKVALLDLALVPDLNLDEKEIRQLILNLSRNAMEAMGQGGVFTIQTYVEGRGVVLAIKDEGIGIEPEIIDRLGTPFFTTKDRGTGLGLAVCYGIASRHQAIIEFATNHNGTTVYTRFKPTGA
ncbi:MAG: PAS domain S-box protein [Syntrophomonadaceae bacterium]